MPGGGITARNVARIVAGAAVTEIHFAGLEAVAGGMRARRDHVFMGGELRQPEYVRLTTSQATLRNVITNASS
jgi:copper homeostasis protein